MMSAAISPLELLQFVTIFVIMLSIFALTTFPSVPGGDSGELLAESCIGGTPHPPGYPTFASLSYFFGKYLTIPRVSIEATGLQMSSSTFAWRINFLCCIFGAISSACVGVTAGVVAQSLRFDKCRTFTVLTTAFLYGLCPTTWEYFLTSEVFALNCAILSVLIYLTAKVSLVENSGNRNAAIILTYLCLGAFFAGLALTNQHTSLLSVVILVGFVGMRNIRFLNPLSRPGSSFLIVLSFALGMSPYLYLFVSSEPTKGSWGDTSTIHGFIRHVIRAEYGTFRLGVKEGTESMEERILMYLQFASRESFHTFLPLSVIAVLAVTRRYWVPEGRVTKRGALAAAHSKVCEKEQRRAPKCSKKKKGKGDTSPSMESTLDGENGLDGTSEANTDNLEKYFSKPELLFFCTLFAWGFYTVIWHGVFSNLPLSAPMPYLVHSRFWIQPNILLAVLAGIGISATCTIANKNMPFKIILPSYIVEFGAASIILASVLAQRYSVMDRSHAGWVMHVYGKAILDSLPPHSILLSHTDLDWNTVRYLNQCEHMREDVTHLSFQLMPYPWFKDRQAPLYPHLQFPDTTFRGVSTDRKLEGCKRLIKSFLDANNVRAYRMDRDDINVSLTVPSPAEMAALSVHTPAPEKTKTSPGIFIDMQAIHEPDIAPGGQWHGYTLVPWGLVYRVVLKHEVKDTAMYHQISHAQLKNLNAVFPVLNDQFMSTFPRGSWEHAAMSVQTDAMYQFALTLLSFAVDMQEEADIVLSVLLLDRLYTSAHILAECQERATRYDAFSSVMADLRKNNALAWLRLQALLGVCVDFRKDVEARMSVTIGVLEIALNEDIVGSIITKDRYLSVTDTASDVLAEYVRDYPNDKDARVFVMALEKMQVLKKKASAKFESG